MKRPWSHRFTGSFLLSISRHCALLPSSASFPISNIFRTKLAPSRPSTPPATSTKRIPSSKALAQTAAAVPHATKRTSPSASAQRAFAKHMIEHMAKIHYSPRSMERTALPRSPKAAPPTACCSTGDLIRIGLVLPPNPQFTSRSSTILMAARSQPIRRQGGPWFRSTDALCRQQICGI